MKITLIRLVVLATEIQLFAEQCLVRSRLLVFKKGFSEATQVRRVRRKQPRPPRRLRRHVRARSPQQVPEQAPHGSGRACDTAQETQKNSLSKTHTLLLPSDTGISNTACLERTALVSVTHLRDTRCSPPKPSRLHGQYEKTRVAFSTFPGHGAAAGAPAAVTGSVTRRGGSTAAQPAAAAARAPAPESCWSDGSS